VLEGRLCAQSIDPEPPAEGEPRFFVRFTQPACAALPEHDVPAGALCTGDYSERDFSRAAAGVVDHLITWIDDATAAAEAGREVTITMAYLTWSDGRLYDALCRATAAGVRFEGFFDEQSGGSQAPRLASDDACDPENVTVHRLGGVTSYPSWRLMHVKLVAIDDGSGTTRMVFGSANLSSYGSSIHFESWVFAEAPTDGHFVASHRCAIDAMREAEEASYPEDAARFEDAYDACVAALAVEPDPRFQVFFSPDRDRAMLGEVVDAMRAAESRVDLAIQHFSASRLLYQLADNGRDDSLDTRLVLDDDTFYGEGESGRNDREWYDIALRDAGIDIRFVQTNSRMQFGKQYQHNKYVVIDDDLVFMGAGNFTDVAFGQNYENFYLLRSPELARTYREHFERLFEIGRPEGDLPPEPVAP
jgi:phosphatidylserine/phosphatidylglycerophosphate/cardiolipin synthase-like enzyme